MKRLLVLTPFALLALAPPATAGGGCHTGGPATVVVGSTVKIHGICFFPEATKVAVGDTVTWVNGSGMQHNISGPAIAFADLPNGAEHSQKFTKAGLYPYACTLHPGMSSVVVVGATTAADTAAGAAANAEAGVPSAPAVEPVANTTPDDGGGTSTTAWIVAGVATLLAAGVVLTFARREGRVPLPAR